MAQSRKRKTINLYLFPVTHARLNALANEMLRFPGAVVDYLVDREWKVRHPDGAEPVFEPFMEKGSEAK